MKRRTFVASMTATTSLVNAQVQSTRPSNRISIALNGQLLKVTLFDHLTARDLLTLLPLDGTAKDFGSLEKVFYLTRKLTTKGAAASYTPVSGDLCYYAPWGNLALFHGDGHPSPGLIHMGRFEGDLGALRIKGEAPLRIALLP
jgi:hypothetical protein